MALAYNGSTLGLHPRRHGSIPCGATLNKKKKRMIHFKCTYCEKPINGITIIIDKTHFVHPECETDFNKTKTSNLLSDDFSSELTKRMRERIKNKWGSHGLLEGLKEPVPSNLAMMLECCKSNKIDI